MDEHKKWYQKTGGIIVLLIFFFPVGLYLMWKHAPWSKVVKWITTGFFTLVLIGSFNSDKSNTSPITPQPTQAPQAQATATPTKKPEPTKATKHELDAIIKFNELAFLITNNEKEDWTNCKFEMNSGLLSGGYVFRTDLLKANDPVIVPFRNFTKSDGTRFNSETTAPKNVSVSCDVNGVHGFNYYGIK